MNYSPSMRLASANNSDALAPGYLLHPNYVLRVAGGSTNDFLHQSALQAAGLLAELNHIEQQLAADKQQICDLLSKAVAGQADKQLSRALINTKRAVFNQQLDKVDIGHSLLALFDAAEQDVLISYQTSVYRKLQLELAYNHSYQHDIAQCRDFLRSQFSQPDIANAIMYTNSRLYLELEQYFSGARQVKEKKVRSMLGTLASYVIRAATKTSPLSTFTSVHMGDWQTQLLSGSAADEVSFSLNSQGKKSVIKIKNSLILALFTRYLNELSNLGADFPLTLNPSLQQQDGKVRFKTIQHYFDINAYVIGNIEKTAEIAENSLLIRLIDLFKQAPQQTLNVAQLQNSFRLASGITDQTKLDTYLQKLLSAQLMCPSIRRYEQEDIITDYLAILQMIPGQTSEQASAMLTQVAALLTQYSAATIEQRITLKEQIEQLIQQLDQLLDARIPSKAYKNCFHEDSYFSAESVSANVSGLNNIKQDLSALLSITPLCDYNNRVQSVLAQAFLTQYGADGVCADPEQFFGTLQDELQCTGVLFFDRKMQHKLNEYVAQDPELQQLEQLNQTFVDYVIARLDTEQTINLEPEFVRQLANNIPERIRNRGNSHCFFGQVAHQEQQRLFVLNQSYPGHSKFFSRFFDIRQDDIGEVREYISSLCRFGNYMELPGVFGFNANLHKKMADKEISIDIYNNNYRDSIKLDLKDLTLVYDVQTHRVYFQNAEFGKMDVLHFGFIAGMYMPKLFRILSLSYSSGMLDYIISFLVNHPKYAGNKLRFIPRITLGSVVLWRRSWFFDKSELPETSLPDAEYFRQLQQWFRQAGLPQRCFARFTPKIFNDLKEQNRSEASMNLAQFNFAKVKPTYLDFENPLLVLHFQQLLQDQNFRITFQEALPELADSIATEDQLPRVAELQIELSQQGLRG